MKVLIHTAWLACALSLALPVAAAVESTEAESDEPLFAVPTQMDRIGRILAPVMINGKGPFRLIIDTGANQSTLSPSLVEVLGLVPSADHTRIVNGVTGSAVVPTVFVERIEAGLLVIERTYVPVIGTAMTVDADGILGVAGLQNARVIVDFRRDKVAITRGRARDDPRDFLTINASRTDDGVLVVNAWVRGVRAKAIIDTGAERTLGNLALLDALRARTRVGGVARMTDVYGATPQISRGEAVFAPSIRLGGATISHVDITYGDFPIFKSWDLQDRPALILGMDVLGVADTLVFDFPLRELRVRRSHGQYVRVN